MKQHFILLASVALLSGCSLSPDFTRPQIDAPASFSDSTTATSEISPQWWQNFGSTELNTLMSAALADNNDLRAAITRVEQSRAAAKIAGADLLPAVGASASVSRTRDNPVTGATDSNSRINAGLNVAYEVDLFGRNRAAVEAARAGIDSSVFDKDALNLTVMGDVATTYFNLLNARERLRVADKNITNAKDILRIVQARFDAGSASGLELAQQKSAVASTEAARASIAQSLANTENALAVLIGKAPRTLVVTGQELTGLTIPTVAAGQPSALLERRPDIRAAEARLIAANANIGAARAAFFPSLNIGLDAGVAMASLGDPASSAISLAASLAAPIFQGGRLQGGVEQATARQQELLEVYRKTILTAFQEVEDALAAVKAAETRENAFKTAVEQARTAYTLSRQLFDGGSIDFQTVINAQTTLLQAEDSYTQSRNDRLQAATQLYRTLGGGWQG